MKQAIKWTSVVLSTAVATSFLVNPQVMGSVGHALIALSQNETSQSHHRPPSATLLSLVKEWIPEALGGQKARNLNEAKKHPYLAEEVANRMPGSLRLFFELDAKALRSEAEQRSLEALMVSPEVLAEAESVLTAIPIAVDGTVEKNHMAAAAYFSKSLNYAEGSVKEDQLLAAGERIVLAENLAGASNQEVRDLMIQDKAEILTYLVKVAPRVKSALVKKAAKDPEISKLVQTTLAFHESQKAPRNIASD